MGHANVFDIVPHLERIVPRSLVLHGEDVDVRWAVVRAVEFALELHGTVGGHEGVGEVFSTFCYDERREGLDFFFVTEAAEGEELEGDQDEQSD